MNKQNNSPWPNYAIAILAVFILLTVVAMWLLMAVYVRRDDSQIVRRSAWFLPVARIGSQYVTYGKYLTSRDAIKTVLKSDAVKQAGQAQPMTPALEQNAYNRLVREAETQDLASQRKVAVSDKEVMDAYNQFLQQASSTVPDVAGYLQKTFHWSEQQYRDMVIRPQLLEDKVTATFSSSTDQSTQFEKWLTDRLAKPDAQEYLKF